jgi:stringent starvation protein B
MSDQAGGMTSSKPYLLRALYEWILDNHLTPHIIIDVAAAQVDVPEHVVQDGRLVLNISPTATRNLDLGQDGANFQARFSGTPRDLWVPMHAILAIYARENGQGMMFAGGEGGQGPQPSGEPDKPSGPNLRVIK